MTSQSIPSKVQYQILNIAQAAVATYVRSHCPYLFSKEDIEDIVSESATNATRSFSSFNPDRSKLTTWVSMIAVNCTKDAIDYKMKRVNINQPMVELGKDGEAYEPAFISTYRGDEFEADRELEFNEFLEKVDRSLDHFSGKDRTVAEFILEGCTPKMMAKVIGDSPETLATRACRVRKALRPMLLAG